MIEVQQIADFLNTELNNIGVSQGYNFDIKAEVGKRTNENAIYGIVSTTKADARVDENVDYVFAVELSVPSAQSNENVINVEKIIGEFKNKFHMKNRAFGGGQGTLLISLATPKDYQIKYVVGDDVPLVFTITTEYIRNAVGSGDKHWLLNGMEIPFINESVSVQKEGRTNTIHGESYTKTLLTRQTRYYKFKFDYDNSELCIMLKKDLLNGKYDKVYTLTYYDGVSFTEEQPFTTSVSIFMNGVSNSNKPNVSEFDITFTDVTNEVESEYYLALIDNPFDSTSENTRYFESQEKQKEYYQDKIDNDIRLGGIGCQFVKIKAPNLGSVVITNQVYEIPLYEDKPIYDVFSVANKNYAIIKVVKDEEEEWFYYYVSNQNIGGQNQVMFDLQLDSLQTIYFNPKLEFGDCLIEKAHLNRFVPVETSFGVNKAKFNANADSNLFTREDITGTAKRITERQKLMQYPVGSDYGDWMNKYVKGWVYLYVEPRHEFAADNLNGEAKTDVTFEETFYAPYGNIKPDVFDSLKNVSIPNSLAVLCVPIFNDVDAQIIFDNGLYEEQANKFITINMQSLEKFLNKNVEVEEGSIVANSMAYAYGYKFSTTPPFSKKDYTSMQADVDENDEKILRIHCDSSSSAWGLHLTDSKIYTVQSKSQDNSLFDGIINILRQDSDYEVSFQNGLQILPLTEFRRKDIVKSIKDYKYNPKLYGSDYMSLRLTNETEQGFDYDILKLNNEYISLIATEPLLPGITKQYLRIDTRSFDNNVYTEYCTENLTGSVMQNDTGLTVITSQYQNMLAQNKNFFQQNKISRDLAYENTSLQLSNTAGKTMFNSLIGLMSNPVGSAQSLFNTGMDIATQSEINTRNYNASVLQEGLSVDNIKNSPSSVENSLGEIIFSSSYTNPGLYAEIWDTLPHEKKVINDYMCKYGFNVNVFGNPKDYDHIRHYYNYVKATIESISGVPMSNAIRNDIRQRFMNGVRFWKSDNIDYDMENYEEWLNQNRVKITNSQSLSVIIAYYDIDKEYTQYASKENDFFVKEDINKIEIRYYNEDYVGILNYKINTDGNYTKTLNQRDNYWYDEITFNNATYLDIDLTK